MDIDYEYFSASANKFSHIIDLFDDVMIYGSSNSIIVYDIKNCVVLDKLDGHDRVVTSIKFFNKGNNIISCSSDNSAILWNKCENNKFNFQYNLRGHTDSLDVGDSLNINKDEILSITSCYDTSIGVWINDINKSLTNLNFFTFDLKVFQFEKFFDFKIFVLLATNKKSVDLYTINEDFVLVPISKISCHNDWVRSVDFFFPNKENLVVASGCNRGFIRVVKIKKYELDSKLFNNQLLDIEGKKFTLILDTVIPAHEEEIICVKWVPQNQENNLKLLSCSLDKTMIMWQQSGEKDNETWLEKFRFGELSGNNLGFLGCVISQDALNIIVNSFNGAFHYWKFNKNTLNWDRVPIISGHFRNVNDIQWDINNKYLLSVSYDKTTRIHALCQYNNKSIWLEIFRPQVHGYGINCISSISSTKFVSGSDEKTFRVFKATNAFINSFEKICNSHLDIDDTEKFCDYASVPTLGLSNIEMFRKGIKDQICLTEPPKEETLLNKTLWPEIQKIYGHGYEIYALDVNHEKKMIASACKASNVTDAAICIWNLDKEFDLIQRIHYHRLTVTALKFSPDGVFLVSVSRDRNWALFKFKENENLFELITCSKEQIFSHIRIIWDVSWTFDSKYFVTTSRDKKIVFWELNDCKVDFSNFIFVYKESAYSVDVAKKFFNLNYIVAKGFENGTLIISLWNSDKGWTILHELNKYHTLLIRKVRFNLDDKLATCGEDRYIRILKLNM